MESAKLISAIENAFDLSLPDRYRTFLQTREFDRLSFLHLKVGYLQGAFKPVFDDADYLTNLEAIGDDYGIDDIVDVDWPEDYGDYLPFAVLDPADEDDFDEDDRVGSFLVVRSADPACPIYVWDRDGWMLYPLAASLDDFVAGRAWADQPIAPHDNLGHQYEAFAWTDLPPDDDDE